jgi:hypothetical protein
MTIAAGICLGLPFTATAARTTPAHQAIGSGRATPDLQTKKKPKPKKTPAGQMLGSPVHTLAFTGTNANGYTMAVQMASYAPHRLSSLPGLPFSGRRSLVACQANTQTDVAIPIAVTVKNTTRSFAETIIVHLDPLTIPDGYPVEFGGLGGLSIFGDLDFGSPQCTNPTGPNGAPDGLLFDNWTVASGGVLRLDFYVIVQNYFTPKYPNGNPSTLRQVAIAPTIDISPYHTKTTRPPTVVGLQLGG